MAKIKQTVLTAMLTSTSLMAQAQATHLTPDMIVNAWKNDAYKQTLTPAQLAMLPANPAGESNFTHSLSGYLLARNETVQGTCDHGCPCTTYQMDCSGTAAMDCSNTSAMDCSNTSAMDCSNTSSMNC